MAPIAIRAERLTKAYRLGTAEERADTLGAALWSGMKAPVRNFRRLSGLNTFTARQREEEANILWALRDVSFTIREGEVVGFVGRNGAGKSTLLKILSRIVEPTSGRAAMRGRISSLLEVGTGFHPELTGRENVYMNGTILGMSKREVDRKFDEIAAFSGVERFLDTPIKRYSSGMKARLAFSVAAHLEPEILIIDEVLATGDAEFQRKCLGKMRDVAGSGRTVLFVSHNHAAIQSLCSRAFALRAGRIVDDGPPSEVVRAYLASLSGADGASGFAADNPQRELKGAARLVSGTMVNRDGEETDHFITGEPMTLRFEYDNPRAGELLNLHVAICNADGVRVLLLMPKAGEVTLVPDRRGVVSCTIPALPLSLGDYRVETSLFDGRGRSDVIPNALFFTVSSADAAAGYQALPSSHAAVVVRQAWDQESLSGAGAEAARLTA